MAPGTHCTNGFIRRDWEACTKGRMTKKLFSKLGNDQERDVLELTHSNVCDRDWRQEFSDGGGLTLPTRGLKYGTINAKNLRKITFYLPTGASMLGREDIAPYLSPGATPEYRITTYSFLPVK